MAAQLQVMINVHLLDLKIALEGFVGVMSFYSSSLNFLRFRVFSADGHYGLIVSLRGWRLSRHVINLNQ